MKWLNFPLCVMFALLVISCDETTTTTSTETIVENQDSTQKTTPEVAPPPPPRGPFFNDAEQALLEKHFQKESVASLSDMMYELRDAKTEAELEKTWQKSTALQEKMEKYISDKNIDIYPMIEELRALDTVMQYYLTDCVAECTEFRYSYNIKEMKKLAAQTEGKNDDNFFDLLLLAEGEIGGRSGGWYNFFEQTWDYGGGSLLGDGLCLDFLTKSWNQMQKSDLFKKDLASLREICFMNMGHPIYMSSQKDVIAELNKVLESNSISEKEKVVVMQILTDVKKGKSRDTSIQFACKGKDCDWGG